MKLEEFLDEPMPNKLIPQTLRKRLPIEQELQEARSSLAYWWYQCLALNEGYVACCENEGVGNFAELYADMGDVRKPFPFWWLKHGRHAFAEQKPFNKVIKLESTSVARTHLEREDVLVLSIPLTLRKTTAKRLIGKLLNEAYAQRPTVDIWKASTAKRMIIKNKMRLSTIKNLVGLWRLRQQHPDDSLYELGRKADIELDLLARNTDGEILTDEMERRRMTIAVSRQLKQARNLIENAGLGVFPSLKLPPKTSLSC